MKSLFKILMASLILLQLSACSGIKVVTDYDQEVNFKKYNSFAFYKPGIDKAEISDLDKKRILRAIESELLNKGFIKSTEPDLLISIFTETRENININQNNFGYGWGWNPWFWGPQGMNTVTKNIEGTLYIDLIDANKNQLVWQGLGTGVLDLDRGVTKKIEKINKIVAEILAKYPPEPDNK